LAVLALSTAIGGLVFIEGVRYADHCRRIGRKTIWPYRPRRRGERDH